MGWIAGAIIFVAIIYFMIVFPRFRVFAIALVVLIGVGLFYWIEKENKEGAARQKQRAEQERWETTAIPRDQVTFLGEVSLVKEGTNWVLKGTVANNSNFNLHSIRFLVTMRDCPDPTASCRTIGEENTRTQYVSDNRPLVPPGQVRLFETYGMAFKNMPPAIKHRWEYRVTEIRAAH